LTGAVASQSVTEAPKGPLSADGNRACKSARAQGGLTATPTRGAGGKPGPSDPTAPRGRAVDYRIKATPGITGLSRPRVHIDGGVWHLDVGSSHPGAGVGPKGWAVRPLKRYASWVQNVVRQFGLYPPRASDDCGARPPVREDRGGPTAGAPAVPPGAAPGSHVGPGEALTASKREAPPKMSRPAAPREGAQVRPPRDQRFARRQVEAPRGAQPGRPNGRGLSFSRVCSSQVARVRRLSCRQN
jgi:hypothetical protein